MMLFGRGVSEGTKETSGRQRRRRHTRALPRSVSRSPPHRQQRRARRPSTASGRVRGTRSASVRVRALAQTALRPSSSAQRATAATAAPPDACLDDGVAVIVSEGRARSGSEGPGSRKTSSPRTFVVRARCLLDPDALRRTGGAIVASLAAGSTRRRPRSRHHPRRLQVDRARCGSGSDTTRVLARRGRSEVDATRSGTRQTGRYHQCRHTPARSTQGGGNQREETRPTMANGGRRL